MTQAMSYHSGFGGLHMVYRTIPSLLKQRADEIPDRAAHIFRDLESRAGRSRREVITFHQVAERSLNIAAYFLDLGLKPGDRVGVCGDNCPEWVYLEYACLRIGVLLIKIQSQFSAAGAFQRLISSFGIKVLVTDKTDALMDKFSFIFTEDQNNFKNYGVSSIECVLLLKETFPEDPNLKSLTQLAYSAPGHHLIDKVNGIEVSLSPDDPAVTFQSSGTTGAPKVILYSHYGLLNYGRNTCPKQTISYNGRSFVWLGSELFTTVIFCETRLHITSDFETAGDSMKHIFDVMEQEQATGALFSPYMLLDIKSACEADKIKIPPTLRNVRCSGERIPLKILQSTKSTFTNLVLLYAASECPGGLYNFEDHGNEEIPTLWYKLAPYSEMKLVDETGNLVPRGDVGRVQLRSTHSMIGYLDPTSGLVDKLPAGWFNTGDLGIMRDDGCFDIIGRIKEVISHGALKIYPRNLENILYMHDKVDKAVVVGVPDPKLCQEMCAFVIQKAGVVLTEEELREFFKTQVQADDTRAIPRYYIFTEKLTWGMTGKIDRKQLEKTAKNLLQL